MKILQVCPRYYPDIGGVEEHVRNIGERLAKRYDVSVFTTDPLGKLPRQEVINGVQVTRFKSWAPNEAYYFSGDLKRFLSENSHVFDVVHAHSYHALPAYYATQAKSKNKLIFTPHYHGMGHSFFRSLLHIPYRYFGRKIFEKSDRIICVSNYEKNLVVKRFKVDEEKIVVIPNGVNLNEFNDLKKTREDHRTILCVSRLEKYKGIQYLIKVLPLLENDVILEVVGNGPYRDHLVKLARKLNVFERVRFFQDLPRGDLLQKYVNADVFALLSKHEAYGLSVAEALFAGTPCIVTNASALSEWIDNENCFGIEYPINSDSLVNLLNKVMRTRIKGVKLPDWSDVTRKLEALYNSIL